MSVGDVSKPLFLALRVGAHGLSVGWYVKIGGFQRWGRMRPPVVLATDGWRYAVRRLGWRRAIRARGFAF